MSNLSQEEKENHQRRVINEIQAEHTHPVSSRDDTQIGVFIRPDGDDAPIREDRLSLFPKGRYEPYRVKNVFPLSDSDFFSAWVVLSPDWRLVGDDE